MNIGHFLLHGDFVAASGSSRTSAGAGFPFGIPMPGISGPAVKSYAVWNTLTSTPFHPTETSIILNGFPVVAMGANAATPDLCWGYTHTATYWADVTGLVVHGGVNVVGAGDIPATGALGEGVSLLTVYSDAAMPMQSIDVFWNGLPGMIANNLVDGENHWAFTLPYIGGPAHGFTNALDGQPAGDDFVINGGLASGLYGTFAPGDAWIGNVGPYYDHAEGDFSPFMAFGDAFMDIGTPLLAGDCIGHTFGAIAFRQIPTPGSLALVGMGVLAVARRRR
ncbi:MAG: PEP-CTERM sorting domain-containing protein [Phycisphaeraceae bacterium]|nr:PEP-CTERM sorting domain-containing protein [Phycisphaerae bacterium]MBX3392612.1 PEP-CTERM sorting domain-containing protein [Phycisphaeraceae bacterium]